MTSAALSSELKHQLHSLRNDSVSCNFTCEWCLPVVKLRQHISTSSEMRESPLRYLEVKGFSYCHAASVLPPKSCGQSNFPLSTPQTDKRDVSGLTQNWQPDIYTHFTEWLAGCADIWKEPELELLCCFFPFLSQLKQCLCFTFFQWITGGITWTDDFFI